MTSQAYGNGQSDNFGQCLTKSKGLSTRMRIKMHIESEFSKFELN